jgi:hypothetical protein
MYTVASRSKVVPVLWDYLHGYFATHASFSHESKSYTFREETNPKHVHHIGGLLNKIRARHYPQYTQRQQRRHQKTQRKGSSAKQGKLVDAQLMASFKVAPTHRMAIAIMEHFRINKQTLQACQVPCYVNLLQCMTQADVITRDSRGNLYLYEIKTGYPIGGFHKQGVLRNIPSTGVASATGIPNTKMNHWQLQLRYTQLALEQHGVHIHRAYILQVYDYYNPKTKCKTVRLKLHTQADWVLAI